MPGRRLSLDKYAIAPEGLVKFGELLELVGCIKNALTGIGRQALLKDCDLAENWSAFYEQLLGLSGDLRVLGGMDYHLRRSHFESGPASKIFTNNGEGQFQLRIEWKAALENCEQTDPIQALRKNLEQFCNLLPDTVRELERKQPDVKARYKPLRTGVWVAHHLSQEPPLMLYGEDSIFTKDQKDSVLFIFPDPDSIEGGTTREDEHEVTQESLDADDLIRAVRAFTMMQQGTETSSSDESTISKQFKTDGRLPAEVDVSPLRSMNTELLEQLLVPRMRLGNPDHLQNFRAAAIRNEKALRKKCASDLSQSHLDREDRACVLDTLSTMALEKSTLSESHRSPPVSTMTAPSIQVTSMAT